MAIETVGSYGIKFISLVDEDALKKVEENYLKRTQKLNKKLEKKERKLQRIKEVNTRKNISLSNKETKKVRRNLKDIKKDVLEIGSSFKSGFSKASIAIAAVVGTITVGIVALNKEYDKFNERIDKSQEKLRAIQNIKGLDPKASELTAEAFTIEAERLGTDADEIRGGFQDFQTKLADGTFGTEVNKEVKEAGITGTFSDFINILDTISKRKDITPSQRTQKIDALAGGGFSEKLASLFSGVGGSFKEKITKTESELVKEGIDNKTLKAALNNLGKLEAIQRNRIIDDLQVAVAQSSQTTEKDIKNLKAIGDKNVQSQLASIRAESIIIKGKLKTDTVSVEAKKSFFSTLTKTLQPGGVKKTFSSFIENIQQNASSEGIKKQQVAQLENNILLKKLSGFLDKITNKNDPISSNSQTTLNNRYLKESSNKINNNLGSKRYGFN